MSPVVNMCKGDAKAIKANTCDSYTKRYTLGVLFSAKWECGFSGFGHLLLIRDEAGNNGDDYGDGDTDDGCYEQVVTMKDE